MDRELGPRTVGDIVSEAFGLYGKGFLVFGTIVIIPEVVLFVLGTVVFLPVFFTRGFDMGVGISPFMFGNEFELGVAAGLVVFLSLLLVIISIMVSALMQGALIHAVSEQAARQTSNFGKAYSTAWQRVGRIIGVSLLVGLVIIVLGITIIGIPFAIYFGVRWSFVIQVVIIEGSSVTEAMSRSSAIVQGNWWRVFGIMLVVGLIVWLISFVLSLVPVIGSILGAIVATPIFTAGQTLLYFDLRYRERGYTTDTLAGELGV